ncbi:mRNA cap guanine-N7 methyltransferase [Coniosporium apollinis]|uniref:mRNA cap guanine-N(7) methyltransferase n=1 Tax=Coniosporium apollinis TaxID=61459 RepID=A0ABQ9NY03_9PEZI|nr:mRNA cap guanine-N7 methyltransferase [Coniosporium apollinis]
MADVQTQKRAPSRSPSGSPETKPRKRPGAASRVSKAPASGRPSAAAYQRRPEREQRRPSPDASTRKRSRSRSPSPARPRKRPGAASRINQADIAEAKKREQEREQERAALAQASIAGRGVHDVVKQHYNAVPERGREWRKTDSKIKGLRSFNNWVKSCLIQKFAPTEQGLTNEENIRREELLVLDVGCGKGGDLQKWQSAPQRVGLYIGLDPADVSIDQAKERYGQMQKRAPPRGRPSRLFEGHFFVKDCFGEWIGDIPLIQQVGIDGSVGPGGGGISQRWGGGGFDIVSMMFCMHYAFESEAKARGMLKNVAGALKKGGRFLGVIPNSDVLSEKVEEHHKTSAPEGANGVQDDSDDNWDPEKSLDEEKKPNGIADDDDDDWDPEKTLDTDDKKKEEPAAAAPDEEGEIKEEGFQWGNSIYTVKFPGKTPKDGIFRPPFGWKYFYFLEEAVEQVPEYVVPWEAFRALAEDYNLELQYRKPFNEVWDEEKDDPTLGPLSERMGVRGRDRGPLLVSNEEFEAASFYHAFCFYKV